jgi:6-phosphogluconolactonase
LGRRTLRAARSSGQQLPHDAGGAARQSALEQTQIFRIQGELDPEEGAAKYEFDIRQSFRLEGAEIPSLIWLLWAWAPMGIPRPFPHTEGLHEMMRIAIANHVVQKDAWRVTLTWPVINRARGCILSH